MIMSKIKKHRSLVGTILQSQVMMLRSKNCQSQNCHTMEWCYFYFKHVVVDFLGTSMVAVAHKVKLLGWVM